MKASYEIVKYTPAFKSQVVEIQKHLWGPDPVVNAAYLEWKYERNPYTEAPLIYLALHEGQVVGMRGLCGAQWQIGRPSSLWSVLVSGDLVVAPEHRNRGLPTQIMRAALDDLAGGGYTYLLSLSARKPTYLSALAMGWRGVGSLQRMERKGHGPAVGNPFHLLDRQWLQRRSEVAAQVSLEHSPRPEAMAELVAGLGHDGRARQVRDQRYLARRFLNPRYFYRFLFWEASKVEGYLVLQAKRDEHKVRFNIVDWEAAHSQALTDLLQAAVRVGDFARFKIWSATLPEATKTLLQSNGFTLVDGAGGVARYHPTLLIRPVRDAVLRTEWVLADRRLLDPATWDLRMIYSDAH